MQQTPTPNPYDFITNPSTPPKKPLVGGSMKSRLLIVAGGAVVLMILITVVMAVLGGGGGSATGLKGLIAEQEEIIRIADLGVDKAQQSETRAFASNISLTLRTDQIKIEALLADNKGEITPVERSAKKSASTDSSLETAAITNRYDEVVREILVTKLTTYLTSLKSTYDSAKGEKTKAQLSASYNSTQTILGPPQETAN